MRQQIEAYQERFVRYEYNAHARGISHRYLPPYGPDLNPIEPGWAVMKAEPRRTEARSLDQLDAALPHALDQITPSRAQGWFRHAGHRSD